MIGLGWRKQSRGMPLMIKLRESDKREEIVPSPPVRDKTPDTTAAPRWSFTAGDDPSITACPRLEDANAGNLLLRARTGEIFGCSTDTTNTPA
jgi:hypothetical protein